jgi:hypothetical protein
MNEERIVIGGRKFTRGFLLVGVVFFVTRLAVLPFAQPTSDVGIYAEYAYEQEAAGRARVPFYSFHTQAVHKELKQARATGSLVESGEEHTDVEYPPLALLVMRLPALPWWEQYVLLSAPIEAGPKPTVKKLPLGFMVVYRTLYRIGMAIIDLLVLLLLVRLVRQLYPQESNREQARRLLVYVIGTMALWHLLYDRLDLLLTFLLLLAFALLTSPDHYLWSFAGLALGINFKLVPLVLAPVWVLGAMTLSQVRALPRPRALLAAAGWGAVLLAMTLAIFAPFYFPEGKPTLAFLRYHGARGLEIDSVLASLPLALHVFGLPLQTDFSYGSINVQSPLSSVLVALSPWLTAGLLLGAAVLLLVHARHLSQREDTTQTPSKTLAQLYPREFASYTLLFLSLFILANKVFSPQYLLWLIPLVSLLPMPPRPRRWFTWLFVLLCVLSTVLVPFLFVADLIDRHGSPANYFTVKDPTFRVATLLVLRNLVFLGLTGWLALYLYRQRVPQAPVPQDGAKS